MEFLPLTNLECSRPSNSQFFTARDTTKVKLHARRRLNAVPTSPKRDEINYSQLRCHSAQEHPISIPTTKASSIDSSLTVPLFLSSHVWTPRQMASPTRSHHLHVIHPVFKAAGGFLLSFNPSSHSDHPLPRPLSRPPLLHPAVPATHPHQQLLPPYDNMSDKPSSSKTAPAEDDQVGFTTSSRRLTRRRYLHITVPDLPLEGAEGASHGNGRCSRNVARGDIPAMV